MINKFLITTLLFFFMNLMNSAFAFIPTNGIWIISSELDGKPGRGIAIDVQNTTIVAAVYAYETTGQSTFYLGSGTLTYDNNDRPSVSMPMQKFANGRHFGSPAKSGIPLGNAGTATFEFTTGVTGYVTFPGEQRKAISRFKFAYPFEPSSLLGLWLFTHFGSSGIQSEIFEFSIVSDRTSTGNGIVYTSDYTIGCEHKISGTFAGVVLCFKFDRNLNLLKSHLFGYVNNDGDGLAGLGDAEMDQFLIVRRLLNSASQSTGILYKSEDQTDIQQRKKLIFDALNKH